MRINTYSNVNHFYCFHLHTRLNILNIVSHLYCFAFWYAMRRNTYSSVNHLYCFHLDIWWKEILGGSRAVLWCDMGTRTAKERLWAVSWSCRQCLCIFGCISPHQESEVFVQSMQGVRQRMRSFSKVILRKQIWKLVLDHVLTYYLIVEITVYWWSIYY